MQNQNMENVLVPPRPILTVLKLLQQGGGGCGRSTLKKILVQGKIL